MVWSRKGDDAARRADARQGAGVHGRLCGRGGAEFADGRYTLTVDDPFGLRCDNIYYGPTISTHDVYTWNAATLAGSMRSTFDSGCDGAPAGALEYPFTLSRL